MYKEDIRYIARFVVETNSPIAIGTGEKGLTVDRIVAKDFNGLPYIPGTSLAGVIRHELDDNLDENVVNSLFGFQGGNGEGQGSRISFSSAMLLAEDGKNVHEGLQDLSFSNSYYSYFNRLPERDHVRITDKGTADTKGHGKFDEQLIHKGVRFVFEIELEGTEGDSANWEEVLKVLHHPSFRIGAGTRNGFGQLKVVECKTKKIDLNKNILDYIKLTASLNKDVSEWDDFIASEEENINYHHYKVTLSPENFYMFGAGIGDNDVDMAPKKEKYFDWSTGKPILSDDYYLIPATSIKGALSHRVAYWYNKNNTSEVITIDKNLAEYSGIDELELHNSLSELKAMEEMVNSFKNISDVSFGEDVEELKALKENLEDKKLKIKELIKQLENYTLEDKIESSEVWNDFEDTLETEYNLFQDLNPNVSEMNEAVRELFGFAKDSKKSDGLRGRVIMSDLYINKDSVSEKVFDHVAIDRFTGGGINGALYQEKAIKSDPFILHIYVEIPAFVNNDIKVAFEKALEDLVSGRLQLGGNTGKGHGAFVGEYELVNMDK
jgi:CRISPR/Cas system CSM-associated protein Csm3 (group 7 of RAMP superfamily)